MREEKEKFDLVNYELSRRSLQRSLSLNDEDLPRMEYSDHTATASTSLSTTSVPQNFLQSTLVTRNYVSETVSCHAQNGKNEL